MDETMGEDLFNPYVAPCECEERLGPRELAV